jgi:predicted nucleic acid-binding protein
MKLLDTNIFVYSRGRPGPFKEPCARLLTAAAAEPGSMDGDVESLQELPDVYTRRGQRGFAADMVEEVLVVFSDPLPITRREIEEAADIVKGYRGLTPRDAIHAAVVITYGLEGIVSADRSFDQIAGLMRFDPRRLPTDR